MDNKKKLLLMEKIIYFKKTKIMKINDIYKVSSLQILYYWQLFYAKSAVTGLQNTTNPGLKIFGYNVLRF